VNPCYMPVQFSICAYGYEGRSEATRACLAYHLCRATLLGDGGSSSNLDQFCPAVRGEGADPCGISQDAAAD
jgi:hypothetical protein